MNGRSSCVAPEVVYSGGGAGQALHAYEFLEHADNALALNLCMAFRCIILNSLIINELQRAWQKSGTQNS